MCRVSLRIGVGVCCGRATRWTVGSRSGSTSRRSRASVSPAHFSRQFRATFGETPHRYLQRRRVERAMELLRETDRPVTEISARTRQRSLQRDESDGVFLLHRADEEATRSRPRQRCRRPFVRIATAAVSCSLPSDAQTAGPLEVYSVRAGNVIRPGQPRLMYDHC